MRQVEMEQGPEKYWTRNPRRGEGKKKVDKQTNKQTLIGFLLMQIKGLLLQESRFGEAMVRKKHTHTHTFVRVCVCVFVCLER